MNVHYAKFQKSLIVEQFQGNYLNTKKQVAFPWLVERVELSSCNWGMNASGEWDKIALICPFAA